MEAPPLTGWPARARGALASRWALPVLGLAAFATSLVVQRVVFPGLSWNRDEPVYLWHAEVLRAGQLSTPDGGYPDLFQPWLSASRDGSLFSQYTLGWPLVLMVGSLLGSTDLAVAAGAALAVVGTRVLVEEVLRDRVVATVAAAFMLASPILALQGGVHLNYLFTLGLGLLFLACLFRGVRAARPGRLVAAGLLLGWVFLTRPYDAVIWSLLGAVAMAIEHRHRLGTLLRSAGWAALGFVPLLLATLLLNRHLTGSATEFPITVADPLDRFGFGDRRLMPGFDKVPYGKRLALESVGRSSFWLPFFLFGAHLGVVLAAAGAFVHRARRGVWLIIALGLAFPVGYLTFFGTHISSLTARLSGPIYYIPAYVGLCTLMAMSVVGLARRRPAAAAALVALLVTITVPVTANRLEVNQDLSRANLPWARSVEELTGPSLVVVSPQAYLLFLNPFGENGADLDGPILYASDAGPEVLDLVEEHPDRTPYLQRADRSAIDLLPREDPVTPEVLLTPMRVLRGPVHLRGSVVPFPDAGATVRWLTVDGKVLGATTPVTSAGPVDIDLTALALPEGLHTLELRLGKGDDIDEAARAPRSRRTFYVRVTDGEVTLLGPGTGARRVKRPGEDISRWEDELSLPELAVDPVLGPVG